jgi:hypothetical protein
MSKTAAVCGKHRMGRSPCAKDAGHRGNCDQRIPAIPDGPIGYVLTEPRRSTHAFEVEAEAFAIRDARTKAVQALVDSLAPPHERSSEARKALPLATGVLAYFPDAVLAVAECSRIGNEKHNAGEPLHWAKEKSTDEPDAMARHLIDCLALGPTARQPDGIMHGAALAWRALAYLQRAIEAGR